MTVRAPVPPVVTRRPAPLTAVLAVTFLGSIGSGGFWAGIFFVTAAWYGFSPVRNLALASLMGVVYAVAAAFAGRLLRAVERWLSPRSALAGTLCVWGLVAVLPLLAPGLEWVLWVAAIIGAAASAVMFPIVESYLTAGRHGRDMRSAIGW
ncbi:MAG: hypothetical protein H7X95_14445, partial [Deltaproteobacteria bacterium]|nr:hypothetical protein [Deltaproteobacteria bacterium]